jgi:hypothetical protein
MFLKLCPTLMSLITHTILLLVIIIIITISEWIQSSSVNLITVRIQYLSLTTL